MIPPDPFVSQIMPPASVLSFDIKGLVGIIGAAK